jgi:mannose-6-phosphate isomerase class I
MKLQKFRWSKVYESTEEELLAFLQVRDITVQRHEAEAFTELTEQITAQDSTLWCAEGSYSLKVGEQTFSMQPGDAIRLPSQTAYSITAGLSGCAWYQS